MFTRRAVPTTPVPVHIPVNVTGVTANLIGLLDPTSGNASEND